MRKSKRSSSRFLAASSLVVLLATAAGPVSADGRHKLEGTWLVTLDATSVGLPPIVALFTFNKGGTLTQTQNLQHANSASLDPFCGCTASPGHGIWKKLRGSLYRYAFDSFFFAGPGSRTFNLELSEPISVVGQQIGTGEARGVIRVRGNRLWGKNAGTVVNLDGELLNPDIPAATLEFTGKRLGFD